MSTQAETLDRDGFTPAEQAYFASQGANVEGLADEAIVPDATTVDPALDAKTVVDPVVPDPNLDPFDELETVAKVSKDKSGRVIPEANFRVVSEKYKLTKNERDDLRKQLEARDVDIKSAREEAQKEREMRTRIDERLKLFNEVIAPAASEKPAKKEKPDPEQDIFGYVKWLEENHAEQIAELKGQVGQTAQTVQETNEDVQLRNAYQGDAVRFAQSTPDFAAAYQHLNKVRDAMLENVGHSDPEERNRIRLGEEKSLVAQSLKTGKSPAAIIYAVAKSLGYVKASSVADPVIPGAVPGAVVAAPGASVTEEIERIQKAQNASKSLSSGGGAAVGAMTVETLANMSEADFEAYARKNPAVVKELMGG
jgi:hypothetical protein